MADARDFESQIRGFERAWQRPSPPAIADFLSRDESNEQRHNLLVELICVDLECRWNSANKNRAAIQRMVLDDYVQTFPELNSLDDLPLELIGEEYRVRQLWGDTPGQDDFLARFARRRDEIKSLLLRIDDELRNEADEFSGQSRVIRTFLQRRSAAIDPQAPLAYSDFLLEEMIGAGRMGKVYRARQRSLDRLVAVKYLRKSFLQHGSIIERFITEARTVARLDHPGIVGIHGLGRTPAGGYFIAMEFVDGFDLAHINQREVSVSIRDAIEWTCQTCDAINHAHERGVIHCDLKPGNLLLDREGRIRVTDFGLARMVVDDTRMDDCIEGTVPFMAPEQVSRHWGPIGPATDVYGMGAVLYTLLTGRPPFDGFTLADILAQVISAAPVVGVQNLRAELSSELDTICMRCLKKSPTDRFRTAGELNEALTALKL